MEYVPTNQCLPPEGHAVMTKIDDHKGVRNEQELIRKGNLWFFPDMSMHVYYRPTHWKNVWTIESYAAKKLAEAIDKYVLESYADEKEKK